MPYPKVKSKWVKALHLGPATVKLLDRKHSSFLDTAPKALNCTMFNRSSEDRYHCLAPDLRRQECVFLPNIFWISDFSTQLDQFCFMYFEALLLDEYTFINSIFFHELTLLSV